MGTKSSPPHDPNESNPSTKHEVLGFFQSLEVPLYAILDGARDGRVLGRLMSFATKYQSLYEGEAAVGLAPYAPYLVRLPPDSSLLKLLVDEGWGLSWGVYLTSPEEFSSVRHHLRHFLLVQHHDGRELYFRFYDPRVLRTFLPVCTFEELRSFFGPISAFWSEEREVHSARLLKYTLGPLGLESRCEIESSSHLVYEC